MLDIFGNVCYTFLKVIDMACFHPNYVSVREGRSQFMGSSAFLKSGDLFYDNPGSFQTLVPCGHCMGCRLDHARVWADRMILELRDNDYKAIFVTLTYNNQSLPRAWHVGYNTLPGDVDQSYLYEDEGWVAAAAGAPATLSVRDTQLFLKRLRKAFPERRIRYFLAGEYGPKTHRPHYHAIIFGLTLDDFKDLRILDFNDLGQPRYKSKSFERIWGNGFCVVAPVNWNTCAYVSRYTTKKIFKSEDPNAYACDQVPPFCTMSRRPGIGLLHADDLLKKGDKAFVRDFDISGKECVREVYLGRAFLRSALRVHLKSAFYPSGSTDVSAETESVLSLHARQTERVCNSIHRSASNLAVFGGCVLDFYQSKEVHFLDRVRLLPERGDLFEQAKACKSG